MLSLAAVTLLHACTATACVICVTSDIRHRAGWLTRQATSLLPVVLTMTNYNYYWAPAPNSRYAVRPCVSPRLAPAATPGASHAHSPVPPPPMNQVPTPSLTAGTVISGQPIFLRVINHNNKKEWQDYTLQGIRRETMESPAKMRQVIVDQCGEGVVPEEIGYFEQAT